MKGLFMRMWISVGMVMLLVCSAADAQIVLTAEQSTGGKMITFADGSKGVALDKSLDGPKADVAIVWKVEKTLEAGWWHGVMELGPREGDDRGWVNYHYGIVAMNAQKPLMNVMANIKSVEKPPFRFEFWMYLATPATGVRVQSVYDDLYKYKRSWPITRMTLEHLDSVNLKEEDAATLDLPVKVDGSVDLPAGLPAGVWSLKGGMTKEGTMTAAGEDGRPIVAPFSFDRWRRPGEICFYTRSPLRKLSFQTGAMFKSVMLEHTVVKPTKELSIEGELIKTLDTTKTQTGRLELIGKNLTGETPTFALFPHGKMMAVVTTWDDGAPPDLRCAKVLTSLGYRPTFHMNQNSQTMRLLDQLETLGAEVGSHTLHHPSLHALPPDRAMEECVGMRKILEKQLGHPVVSMAYPNGYTAAYDVDGDYVLRAVKAAGHWSGRTTLGAAEKVDSIAEPLAFKTDGFFGNTKDLERQWMESKAKEGAIFHFWGHSWQIGQTDAQWETFERFVGQFAKHPTAWYASQGELFYWIWERKKVQMTVKEKAAEKVVIELVRPWVHPYLAGKVPVSLRLPAGVMKVVWNGVEVPVVEGRAELEWAGK